MPDDDPLWRLLPDVREQERRRRNREMWILIGLAVLEFAAWMGFILDHYYS